MENKTTIIRQIRRAIYTLSADTEHLMSHTATGVLNTMNARQELLLARGWMGKTLHYLGEETPYKPADKPQDIPPTADLPENPESLAEETPLCIQDADRSTPVPDKEFVVYLNKLRVKIKTIIKTIEYLKWRRVPSQIDSRADKNVETTIQNSWTHLHNASMHLGFQLQHLREKHQDSNVPRSA